MMPKRKIGPYRSDHSLNLSHECFGGMSSRFAINGHPRLSQHTSSIELGVDYGGGGVHGSSPGGPGGNWHPSGIVALRVRARMARHPTSNTSAMRPRDMLSEYAGLYLDRGIDKELQWITTLTESTCR
jgi:hypothetical protein